MIGKDKHPPLDPKRHSTNKRVAAPTKKSFGTAAVVAKGPKTVRVGDASSTSARKVPSSATVNQRNAALTEAATRTREKAVADVQSKLQKRGWRTGQDHRTVKALNKITRT